jgi:alkylhydroperoxidase family enzyme
VNSASIYAWTSLAAPQALACYAPQAEAALNDLIAATADVDDYPQLAAVIRNTCANTLSLPPLITTVANATIDEDMLRSVQAFAEQFSLDVSSLDETLRAPFVAFFGMASTPVAQAIYVADMVPRLRRVLEQPTANIQTAFFEFVRVVYNLHELDPVTTELVRMRGARQHNCRLCKSLRAYSALEAGVKETQLDAVDHYLESDLTAAQKAALTLVDAMIWQPAFIDEHVIADIRQHFTPAQAVELVLDVTRNAANKSIVALDGDAAPFDGVQVYNIDAAGNMQVGLQRPN